MAWFEVPEWSDFQAIRQEVLLQFMEVVEQAGTSFAFPTRTIHVASLPDGGAPSAVAEAPSATARGVVTAPANSDAARHAA